MSELGIMLRLKLKKYNFLKRLCQVDTEFLKDDNELEFDKVEMKSEENTIYIKYM